jgi:hypothetical protein
MGSASGSDSWSKAFSGRAIREDKRGAIPDYLAPILDGLGLDRSNWLKTVLKFRQPLFVSRLEPERGQDGPAAKPTLARADASTGISASQFGRGIFSPDS